LTAGWVVDQPDQGWGTGSAPMAVGRAADVGAGNRLGPGAETATVVTLIFAGWLHAWQ